MSRGLSSKARWIESGYMVRIPYILITNDLIAGIILSQIKYWFMPGNNGATKLRVVKDGVYWLVKKREEWRDEVGVSPKQYDRAIKLLAEMNLVQLQKFKFNGAPTVHIRLNEDLLDELLEKKYNEWLQKIDVGTSQKVELDIPQKGNSIFPKGENGTLQKGKNDIDQKGKTLTETTTETTSEITTTTTTSKPKTNSSSGDCNVFNFYQENFGMISPFAAQSISYQIDELSEELVLEAMKIAVLKNNRNLRYVEGILKKWKQQNVKTLEDVNALEEQHKRGGNNASNDEPAKTYSLKGKYDYGF